MKWYCDKILLLLCDIINDDIDIIIIIININV